VHVLHAQPKSRSEPAIRGGGGAAGGAVAASSASGDAVALEVADVSTSGAPERSQGLRP